MISQAFFVSDNFFNFFYRYPIFLVLLDLLFHVFRQVYFRRLGEYNISETIYLVYIYTQLTFNNEPFLFFSTPKIL